MVYLYAGLGVAMLTGIMAIFEMGLALTGNSLLPSPQDPYLINTDVKDEDKQWLTLLADEAVRVQLGSSGGSQLCDALTDTYTERYVADGETFPWVRDDINMSESDEPWLRTCMLNQGDHRVIVRPPVVPNGVDSSFDLFSCVLQGGSDRCPFEQG